MPPDDRRIYDFYIAGRKSAALAAAVRAGLFDALDREALTPEELASRLGLRARPVRLLCRVLRAMGLLCEDAGRLRLAEDASSFLVRGKLEWLGALIDLENEGFLSPRHVLDALREDRATIYGAEDPWRLHARDPERARRFTEAMRSISARPARSLPHAVDLSGARRLLDVGGGSGVFAIELARAYPELECVVWDLPTVCEAAREAIRSSGVEGRIKLRASDFLAEPFPSGFDAVLFSQILHDWRPETGRQLLERAFHCLAPGGLVLVHEKLVAADGSGPLANALVDLDMLVWTEGQQYDLPSLEAMMREVGFEAIESRKTAGYWTVVLGRRPSRG